MLREQIMTALKEAMKSKDQLALSTIRMINAAIKKKDIDVARPRGDEGISDEEILTLLQSMIKSRRESIDMFEKGNRQDLVEKEAGEIAIIEKFLPVQLGEEGTRAAVKEAIAKTGAAGIKDMGKVMGVLKVDYAGQLDMKKVSAQVRQILIEG